jgi:hypothetical protein
MADLLDAAIEQATQTPQASELVRKSRRFEELRQSPAWAELREELKARREKVTVVLGQKALRGVDGQSLRDEGIYSRGFLDGMELLLDQPDEVEQRLEALITESYNQIRSELLEATGEQSPYA